MKERIVIVVNKEKECAPALAEELREWLAKRAEVVAVDSSRDADLSSLDAGIIVTLGGDGTVLSAARRLHGKRVPVLGINLGGTGVLTEFEPESAKQRLAGWLAGNRTFSERMMVKCDICGRAGGKRSFVGLNDVVVARGALSRVIRVSVTVDGEPALSYDGDGVIVATPTGSTAYALSADGPIVATDVPAFLVVPVCAHSLTTRPVVVSSSRCVAIAVGPAGRETFITVDGQESEALKEGESVEVRAADERFLLVDNPESAGTCRFEAVRKKIERKAEG